MFQNISWINSSFLKIKGHYFFMYAAFEGVTPFIPVIGKDLGFSANAVGFVYTVFSFCVTLSKPLFGLLSDYLQNLKSIIACLLTITAVFYFSVPFIKPIAERECPCTETQRICFENVQNETCLWLSSYLDGNQRDTGYAYFFDNDINTESKAPEELNYKSNHSNCNHCLKCNRIKMNSSELHFLFKFKRNGTEIKNIRKAYDVAHFPSIRYDGYFETCLKTKFVNEQFYYTYQYWIYMFLVVISMTFKFTAMSLTDTACYETLGEKKDHFGRQRLWGTISTGVVTLFLGYLNDLQLNENRYNYLTGFYFMIILFIINLTIIYYMHIPKVNISKNIFYDVSIQFKSKEFLTFGLAVLIIGSFASLNSNFLFWYLRDLGASQTLLGSTVAVQCLIEVPFFFFSGWIIQHLGYFNCLTVTFLSFAIRFGSYAVLNNPIFVLPIEALHGVTYAVFYAAKTSFATKYAAPGTEATVLGIFGALYDGLGYALGSFLGGLGFNYFGGSLTFLSASVFSIICVPAAIVSHLTFNSSSNPICTAVNT